MYSAMTVDIEELPTSLACLESMSSRTSRLVDLVLNLRPMEGMLQLQPSQ